MRYITLLLLLISVLGCSSTAKEEPEQQLTYPEFEWSGENLDHIKPEVRIKYAVQTLRYIDQQLHSLDRTLWVSGGLVKNHRERAEYINLRIQTISEIRMILQE